MSQRSCRSQRECALKCRRGLAEVLALFADPVAKQLKVRSSLKAGGFFNHSRSMLEVRG